MTKFEEELTALINKHSLENESDTPDFLLARYMCQSLDVFNAITRHRDHYYGRSRETEIQAATKSNSVKDAVYGLERQERIELGDVTGTREIGGEFKESSPVRAACLNPNGTAALGGRAHAGPGSPRHPYDRPADFWEENEARGSTSASTEWTEP